jgi:hypothetical protein
MPIKLDPAVGITFPDNSTAATGGRSTPTGVFELPSGTTAQRPTTPAGGMIRFNTTLGYVEFYNSNTSAWLAL